MFYYGWNSWIVEILGGILLGLILLPLGWPWNLLTSLTISVIYERFFDENGWSWKDLGQRAVGQAIPVIVYLIFR